MVVALVHVGVPLKIKDNNRSIGKSVFSYGFPFLVYNMMNNGVKKESF